MSISAPTHDVVRPDNRRLQDVLAVNFGNTLEWFDWTICVGRKKALTLAMLITASGSVVIAFTPTFASIGIFASLILLVARLAQGIAHGGEMGTSVTYLVERAPRGRRALYGSTSWVSVVLGAMMATITGLIINGSLERAEILDWGWRIPFALGGILGLYGLYLRRRLTETETFRESKVAAGPAQEGKLQALLRNWRGVTVVFGLSAGGSISPVRVR